MGSDDVVSAEDMPSLVNAYCQATIVRIPSGVCGSVVAASWVRAFSQACQLGWGDLNDSSPGHFRSLVGANLLDRCPSERAMVAATRLVASVCGLVTPRSARRWTAWYGSACDPDSAIGQEVRRGVTPAMLSRARSRTQDRGAQEEMSSPELRRSGTLRAERDELAKAFRVARFELVHARAMELTTGARCQIAEAALASAMRKNLDLLDQLQHARDRSERAQQSTLRKQVGASRTQQLEEQLSDLNARHNRTLQCFAAMLDSLMEATAKAEREVMIWRDRSPDESVQQELSEVAEMIAKSALLATDHIRATLVQQGIHLPSTR